MRLGLALCLVLLLVSVSPAAAERPLRVRSEDAFATQCRTYKEPGAPGIPSDPGVPGDPNEPGDPSVPSDPSVPGEAGVASVASVPGDPSVPAEPGVPGEPKLRRVCATVQVLRTRFSDGNVETTLFFSAFDENGEIPVLPAPFLSIDSELFVVEEHGTRATLYYPDPSYPLASVTWDATDDFTSMSFSTNFVREKTATGFTRSRLTERERERSADADGVIGPVTFTTEPFEFEGDFRSASLTIRTTITRTRIE